jgi:DNA-binding NarL/FixJ family response regulator
MPTAAEPAISVVIADDQRLIRAGFRVILDAQPGIVVVAEASDGQEAVDLVREHLPSVVLMDIRMPVMDGLEAARQIIGGDPAAATKVLMLTTFDADEYVYEALRLGASGFLLKDSRPETLVAAVLAVAVGDAMIDPVITRRLISSFVGAAKPVEQPPTLPASLSTLTPREIDVLRLVARGLSNLEISRELVVEESTTKTHVARVPMKLGLRDRVQAVVLAYESGFVPIAGPES